MMNYVIIIFGFLINFASSDYAGVILSPTILTTIRGGIRPATETPDTFFRQFELDYGAIDEQRQPGFLRGFVASGKNLKQTFSDPFIKWLHEYMEKGKSHVDRRKHFSRPKAYYAADFGTKNDLGNKDNPKIIIVNHKLTGDAEGNLLPGPQQFDVEVRELWQPWLKRKCNFAVRYIIPNRVNILKLMESQGRFRQEVVFENNETEDLKKKALIKLTFKPTLLQRMRGMMNVVLTTPFNVNTK